MTSFENFHFLRPAWLFALLALVPIFWTVLRQQNGAGAWRRVCDPELLRHLVLDSGDRNSRKALVLLTVAWSAACLALAGPTWERLPQPAFKQPVQTVLALNLAPSMNARDVAPTRLVRARYELLDVLDRVEGAVGLVIFAEEPYAVTPLTDDPSVIASQVPLFESSLMPGRGARLDRAIDQARELLVQAGAAQGRVLILSDGLGDAPGQALDAAERSEAAGFPVSVLGIGGDAESLDELADAGGGRFAAVRADDSDLDHLLGVEGNPASLLAAAEQSSVKTDTWSDAGAWLVILPLLLAPLAFRRGWAGAVGVLIFVGAAEPPTASADVANWFARPDQQGAAAFERGDAADAVELFEDPEWVGAAQYRSGDYAAAAGTLQGRGDTRSQYNLGNALAHANQLEESIAAYDRVLEIEPDHEDARFNRELVEKLLEQQQQQQGQQDQEQQQGQQDQQQQGQQGQEQQQGQQDQQQASQGGSQSGEPSQDEASQSEASSGDESEPSQADASQKDSDDSEGRAENPAERRMAENPAAGQGASDEPARESAGTEPQDSEGRDRNPAEPPDEAGQRMAGGEANEAPESAERPTASAAGSGRELSERDQEVEQWLNRVPDDPGGLLREKLRRRYAERRYGANGGWR